MRRFCSVSTIMVTTKNDLLSRVVLSFRKFSNTYVIRTVPSPFFRCPLSISFSPFQLQHWYLEVSTGRLY